MTPTQKILQQTQQTLAVEISSFADVHIDDYQQGELDHVNYFENTTKTFCSTPETLKADILDALESYVENVIYTTYNEDDIKEQLENRDDSNFFVSVLVDNDNREPNDAQIARWKAGEETLYIQDNCITISVNGTDIECELLNELLFDEVTA
jgi:hypothetical protein